MFSMSVHSVKTTVKHLFYSFPVISRFWTYFVRHLFVPRYSDLPKTYFVVFFNYKKTVIWNSYPVLLFCWLNFMFIGKNLHQLFLLYISLVQKLIALLKHVN